jgi:hypothetical protein
MLFEEKKFSSGMLRFPAKKIVKNYNYSGS